jgi:hypothetical protein
MIYRKKREQNLVVLASNWRTGNLAFVFIEEVGEWKPLVFALFLKVHNMVGDCIVKRLAWVRTPLAAIFFLYSFF